MLIIFDYIRQSDAKVNKLRLTIPDIYLLIHCLADYRYPVYFVKLT